jgi:hypothetical protein
VAATILRDAHQGRNNYSEWITFCYLGDARKAVTAAIRHRHSHRGFMAEYELAKKVVDRAAGTGEEPLLGSWF